MDELTEGLLALGRQVLLASALKGGSKDHNIKKTPYREATPLRAWSFIQKLGGEEIQRMIAS